MPRNVFVPIAAVLAIYARENGAGTMFEPEPAYEAEGAFAGNLSNDETSEPTMSVIDGDLPDVTEEGPDDEPPAKTSGKPFAT